MNEVAPIKPTINYEVKWEGYSEMIAATKYQITQNKTAQFFLQDPAGPEFMFLETPTPPLYIKAVSVNNPVPPEPEPAPEPQPAPPKRVRNAKK